MSSTLLPDPSAADVELVDELLRHSGARPSDALTVAGSGTAGLISELCHRGFGHLCFAAAPCPACAESADILWVPHATPEALADGHLHGFARSLRQGGTILLRGEPSAASPRATALCGMLAEEGFGPVTQVVTTQGFYLAACKPFRQQPRRAA